MLGKPGNGSLHQFPNQPGISSTGAFRIHLLGVFQLTDPFGQPVDVSSKKNRLLIAMLACAPGHSLSRETLAGMLWAEHGEEKARNSLRQALAVLRKELGGQEQGFFASTDTTIALHPTQVWLDTETFLAETRLTTRTALEEAVDLWRGQFLADVTVAELDLEQWLRERREDFNSRYIAAVDRLVPQLDGHRRIDLARQLVQTDSLREASHRHLMEAYQAAGERPQALRQYETLRKLLKDELGVEPSPETQALRNRIAAASNGHHAAPPVAALDVAVPQRPVAAAAQEAPAAAPTQPGRGLRNWLAAALLILAVAAAGWFLFRHAPDAVAEPTVAVLPFESLSPGDLDARVAEGMTVDTITDLTRYWDIKVIAQDTTNAYKGKSVDIRQLGHDLKLSHVVTGTFQRDKDHVRVTAQLIDATTGTTLWSDRFDRQEGEIFAIQSDVADHIANSLGGKEGKVGQSILASAKRKPPADLGAYETYLLAQDTMHSDLSDAHMIEGQKLLDQAIAKDPGLARAYVKYAWAYAWRFTYEGGAAELMQQMLAYARKGVELDPMDADAHSALGYSLTMTGNPQQGEAQFDEALRLNPNAFDILVVYSCMAHSYGKADRGAVSADRAISINPAFPNWSIPCIRLGLVMVGRYEDVVRIQSRQPENEWNTDGYVIMAGSLAALGHVDEAKVLVQHGVARFPGLLTVERFALNRGWPPAATTVMTDLMRKAGFPACATPKELSDTPDPVRLPVCTG